MPLFDAYLMTDWSAAGRPVRGRDSIWWALCRRGPRRGGWRLAACRNPATRAEAAREIETELARLLGMGLRVLAGFDFPFGYPAGTARRLGLRGTPWLAMWRRLARVLEDDCDNRHNLFDVAEGLNRALSGEAFPFWGNVREEARPCLLRRGRRSHGPEDLPERRLCESRLPMAKPVWKLAGVGSVGAQVITGLPRVQALRNAPALAAVTRVWPFETGFRDDPAARVVLAEIYPSLMVPAPREAPVKDAGQVKGVVRRLARLDDEGRLGELFAGDRALSPDERAAALREEAWILGLTGSLPARRGTGLAMAPRSLDPKGR